MRRDSTLGGACVGGQPVYCILCGFSAIAEFLVLYVALSQESSADSGEPATVLRLGDIAQALQGDWLMMATQLGITNAEVIKIQKENGNVTEQVSDILFYTFLLTLSIFNHWVMT